MVDASQIQEHMEVKGSDGKHVGTVDHMENGRIKLTKSDPASGGQHHYLAESRRRDQGRRGVLEQERR